MRKGGKPEKSERGRRKEEEVREKGRRRRRRKGGGKKGAKEGLRLGHRGKGVCVQEQEVIV